MSARVFADTNVLVYMFNLREPDKQGHATRWMDALWASREGTVSTQVLQEFYNTTTRKLSSPMSRDAAREVVRRLGEWEPIVVGPAIILSAFAIEDRFGLSWWDSLIVAAAQIAGCRYLLTEDLHHGQDFEGLEVINFAIVRPSEVLSG